MNQRGKKYQKMILTAAILGLLMQGGMAEASTYTQGMSGSLQNRNWLTDATITKTTLDGQTTYQYDFNGKDSTFNITNYNDTDRETPLFANTGHAVVINNQGGTLHMNVVNHATGIGALNGVSAITASGGNRFTINSNLDLSAKGDYLAEAIKVDGANTHVTINGDVKIRKDDDQNPWAVVTNNIHGNFPSYKGARWAPSLIWNNGNSASDVTIRGNFDGASRGAGIVTDPYGMSNNDAYSTCYINLIDGDIRIETPKSKQEAFYAIANYGGTININVERTDTGYKPQANHKVTLLGNILTMGQNKGVFYAKGRTNIALNTPDSSWTGVIDNSGTAQAGEVNLYLQNGATWTHESRSMTDGLQGGNMPDPSYGNYGNYDGVSHVNELHGADKGYGVIYQRDKAKIEIQAINGNFIFDYAHNNSGESVSDYTAGDVVIHKLYRDAEGNLSSAQVVLSTDDKNINTNDCAQVDKVLGALAKKLYYLREEDPSGVATQDAANATSAHLTGKVQIAEGLVTSGVSRYVGDLNFTNNGQGQYESGTVKKETGKIDFSDAGASETPDIPLEPGQSYEDKVYTDYETGLMKGTRQAVMSSMLSWRDNAADTIHGSDILRDRVPGEKDGVWGKVTSGRMTYGDGSGNKNSYTAFQTGYDRAYDNGWLAGVGVDYRTGDVSLSYGGTGKEKLYSLNLYASKDLGNQAYWDVTGKVGYVTHDFTAYNMNGRELLGKYHNRGYSLSTKWGKRYGEDSTYIEPHAQLTWAYLNSKDFENTSGEDTMYVHQHGYNSFVGRIGLEVGHMNGDSSFYGKVDFNHEFAGDVKGDYSAGADTTKSTSYSTKGNWWDVKVGASHRMFKSGQIYAEFGKTFGGDVKKDWEFNGGLRFLIGQGHTPGVAYKEESLPTVSSSHSSSLEGAKTEVSHVTTTQTSAKPEAVTQVPVTKAEPVKATSQSVENQAPVVYAPITPLETNESSSGYVAMDGNTYILGPVVVTASRVRQPILEAKADISVVSRKELEDFHISNVEEALRTVPGVQFTNYNANQMNGNLSGIRINGSSDIVILVDGVKVTDFNGPGKGGYAYASLMSNPDNIERVEVLRGSSAAMYGSGARGGIINIITRKINKNQTSWDMSKGSFGKENYRLNTQGTKGKLSYNLYNDRTLSGSYKDGDGVRWDGHTNTKAWGGKFVWNFNPDHEMLYSYDETVSLYSGFDPIYISPYDGKRSMKIHTLKDSWKLSDHWANTLTYRQSKEYGLYHKPWGEGDIHSPVRKEAYSDTRDYSYDFLSDQINYTAKNHDVVFGFDYSKAKGSSVNTGTNTGTTSGKHVVKNTSIYAQDDWNFLPKLTFSFGIRHDMPNLDQAPSNTAKSYKLSWDMTDKDTVYVSRNDYYIMPSLDQLYGTTGSNEKLEPAHGNTTTVGYNRKFSDRTFFTFNWFKTKAESDIGMVEETDGEGHLIYDDNGNPKWHYENQKSKNQGWNAQLQSQFNERLSGRIGWAHLQMNNTGSDTFVSHGYAPKDLITFGLTYDWNKWKTSLDGYYFVRLDSKNNHFYDVSYGEMKSFPKDKYAILNWSLDYMPSKNVSFYLKVENLLDTLYAERSDVAWNPDAGPNRWYSLPGRSFLLGMNMRF